MRRFAKSQEFRLSHARKFKSAFPYLQRRLESGFGQLPLDDMVVVLEAERANTPVSVSVLGVMLPTKLLKRTGAAIIVMLQLYMLMHLTGLPAILAPSNEAPPWIGLYDEPLARLATYLLSLAPSVACVYLVFPRDTVGISIPLLIILSALSFACATATIRLIRRIHTRM